MPRNESPTTKLSLVNTLLLVVVQNLVATVAAYELAYVLDAWRITNTNKPCTMVCGFPGDASTCTATPSTISTCIDLDVSDYWWGGSTPPPAAQLPLPPINGVIPSAIGDFVYLRSLNLSANNLIGTIPESLCGLALLEELVLWGNSLTGTIPSCIGRNMTRLRKLELENNRLTGTVPSTISTMDPGRLTSLVLLPQETASSLCFPTPDPGGNFTALYGSDSGGLVTQNECRVDCVSGFVAIGNECSQKCGMGGQIMLTDTIIVPASGGGRECDERDIGLKFPFGEFCNQFPCPIDVDCVGKWMDLPGANWDANLGKWVPAPRCLRGCGPGDVVIQDYRITTHTEFNGTECPFADFQRRQTNISCGGEYPLPCPTDCAYELTPFGACDVECGAGNMTRSMAISAHAKFGGVPCSAVSLVAACDTNIICRASCAKDGDWPETLNYDTASAYCPAGTSGVRVRQCNGPNGRWGNVNDACAASGDLCTSTLKQQCFRRHRFPCIADDVRCGPCLSGFHEAAVTTSSSSVLCIANNVTMTSTNVTVLPTTTTGATLYSGTSGHYSDDFIDVKYTLTMDGIVHFAVSTHRPGNRFLCLGFTSNRHSAHNHMDAVCAVDASVMMETAVDAGGGSDSDGGGGGGVGVFDMHSWTGKGTPNQDFASNIFDASASWPNEGGTQFMFSRPLITGDARDQRLMDGSGDGSDNGVLCHWSTGQVFSNGHFRDGRSRGSFNCSFVRRHLLDTTTVVTTTATVDDIDCNGNNPCGGGGGAAAAAVVTAATSFTSSSSSSSSSSLRRIPLTASSCRVSALGVVQCPDYTTSNQLLYLISGFCASLVLFYIVARVVLARRYKLHFRAYQQRLRLDRVVGGVGATTTTTTTPPPPPPPLKPLFGEFKCVLGVVLTLYDVATDCLFLNYISDQAIESPELLLFKYIAIGSLILPFVTNITLLVLELKSPDLVAFWSFFNKHQAAVAIVCLLSGTNCSLFNIIGSGLLNLTVFSAPLPRLTKSRLVCRGIISHILEDVPQLTMQVLVAIRQKSFGNPVVYISILVSGITLLFSVVKRLMVGVMNCVVEQAVAASDEDGGGGSSSNCEMVNGVAVVGGSKVGGGGRKYRQSTSQHRRHKSRSRAANNAVRAFFDDEDGGGGELSTSDVSYCNDDNDEDSVVSPQSFVPATTTTILITNNNINNTHHTNTTPSGGAGGLMPSYMPKSSGVLPPTNTAAIVTAAAARHNYNNDNSYPEPSLSPPLPLPSFPVYNH